MLSNDVPRLQLDHVLHSAAYLRQTVLLSAYETPETRNLFNQTLKNVSGKVRTTRQWSPVQVPQDLDQVCLCSIPHPMVFELTLRPLTQNFVQFDCTSLKDEPEKRFHHFTTQVYGWPSFMYSFSLMTFPIILRCYPLS